LYIMSALRQVSSVSFVHLRLHSEYSIVDGMVRLDEAVAAAAAVHNKANGLVIRRPRIPPGFNRPKIAGARPRKGAATTSHGRLAILARKPPNPPPRRGA